MAIFELLGAVMRLGITHLLSSWYGAVGLLCLCLFGVGLRARSNILLTAGLIVLMILMTQA